MAYCQNCGYELDDGMNTCPDCETFIQAQNYQPLMIPLTLPWKSLIAGILIIIASIYCLLNAITFSRYSFGLRYLSADRELIIFLLAVFAILAFVIGIYGAFGIFSRKEYRMALFRTFFPLAYGVVIVLVWEVINMVLFFSIMGLIFLIMAKPEFDLIHHPSKRPQRPSHPRKFRSTIQEKTEFPHREKLKELKQMLDDNLITESEYNAKKQELLDKM